LSPQPIHPLGRGTRGAVADPDGPNCAATRSDPQSGEPVLMQNRAKAGTRLPLALHIGIKYGKGGEGRVFSELSKFLPAAGINIVGAVAGPDNVSQVTGGRVVNFAPDGAGMRARLLGARSTISHILRETKPDLVASHFALYTVPALDRLRNTPKVTHFHGPWAAESRQEGASTAAILLKSRLERLVYRQADLVIVLSKAFAELAASQYAVRPERIRIIPGSVDTARFSLTETRQQARSRLKLPMDRPLLLSVRRLVQRMGLTQLVEAMQAVSTRVPDVLLCIAGEGPLKAALERQVNDLGLTRHVHFLGYVEDELLPLLYRAADINIVPTIALEGFGLVAAEAMAAGTPSMVTPVGGLPEVVAGLSSNLIFASSSSAHLAEGLIDVLLGRVRLPDSAACAAFVNTNFTSALMAGRTAAAYQELLSS
jgi:glycosyltransferase involved in cell wall biosynthesis